MRPGWLCVAALAGVLSGGCTPALAPGADLATHPLVGAHLPALESASTLDGQRLEAAGGRPVVVKFFASYCRPCMRSLPEVERIHEEHPDVLVIGVDEDDRPETAGEVVRRFGLTFPVVHDDLNVIQARFQVETLPTTFVSDRAGTIRWVGHGASQPIAPAVEAARIERAPLVASAR